MTRKMLVWGALVALVGSGISMTVVDTADAAVAPWQTFASGNAVGRGTFAYALVSLTATTLEDPTAIRYLVRGDPAANAHINWDIHCWNEDSADSIMVSGAYEQQLPIT